MDFMENVSVDKLLLNKNDNGNMFHFNRNKLFPSHSCRSFGIVSIHFYFFVFPRIGLILMISGIPLTEQ